MSVFLLSSETFAIRLIPLFFAKVVFFKIPYVYVYALNFDVNNIV